MIELTDKAAQKIQEIAQEESLEEQYVRVNIVGAGCAGFSFDFYFEAPPLGDSDVVVNTRGVNLVVNEIAALYLDGTEIDYVNSLFGEGFKFNNSNFSSFCGCGKSFAL